MEGIVEGLLYVQGDLGLTLEQIENILEIDEEKAKELVYNLKNYYVENNRGLRVNFLGNTIKLTTNEEYRDYYRKLVEDASSNNLSQSALEVLAIIAYNSPITVGQIDEIRGVASRDMVRKLLFKGLIDIYGKSDLPGKPMLYKTTDKFLDYFNLSNINELPNIDFNIELNEEEKDLFFSKYNEEDKKGE